MDQVTVRLDGVIDEIRAMQGPLINGERPADVMLVRCLLTSKVADVEELTFVLPGGSRSHTSSLRQEVVEIPDRSRSPYDIPSWWYQCTEVRQPQRMKEAMLTMRLSYKNRNVEEPGFFVGLALPADN